jgi:RimJ/RimL family protein N-acetyltransferase
VPKLIFGQDHILIPWICGQLDMLPPHPCVTIVFADDDKILGCALYHNQQVDTNNRPFMIEISFATIDKGWASRSIISSLLHYPFSQLRVKRVQSTVSKRNKQVRLFLEGLGFKLEGVGRQAWPHGGDAVMYSLLSGEFFSSKWNYSGKKRTFGPGGTRSSSNIVGTNSEQQRNCSL